MQKINFVPPWKLSNRLFSLAALLVILTAAGWGQKDGTAGAAPAPLTPEIKHKIIRQLRSRFSLPDGVTILISDPTPSDKPEYDTIQVTFKSDDNKQTHEFLISKDYKTLAHFEKFDISQDLMAKISLAGRPERGNPNAKITVVVYDDFQCPYCGRMYNTVFPDVFGKYKDKIKIVYKDYPLTEIHPWAMHAAIDANCLAEQNTDAYWEFSDYVHANQRAISGGAAEEAFQNLDAIVADQGNKHHLDTARLQSCVKQHDDTAVLASVAEGDKLGVESTPTMFVDNVKYMGALSAEETSKALDTALADAATVNAKP